MPEGRRGGGVLITGVGGVAWSREGAWQGSCASSGTRFAVAHDDTCNLTFNQSQSKSLSKSPSKVSWLDFIWSTYVLRRGHKTVDTSSFSISYRLYPHFHLNWNRIKVFSLNKWNCLLHALFERSVFGQLLPPTNDLALYLVPGFTLNLLVLWLIVS